MKRYSTFTSSSLSSICNKSASDRICILSVRRFVWLTYFVKSWVQISGDNGHLGSVVLLSIG